MKILQRSVPASKPSRSFSPCFIHTGFFTKPHCHIPNLVFPIVLFAFTFYECGRHDPVSPDQRNRPDPINYVTPPPSGMLPWPQHDPEFSALAYENMMDNLFIINNFGQYQGGDTKNSVYFHDGLDVVLENGTKIFAVDSGYVKSIIDNGEFYTTLAIAGTPGGAPGEGWSYTHINNIRVKVGDFVRQGTYLADIHFQGVPHVHLSRVILTTGSWSDFWDMHSVSPDSCFSYEDAEPPVVEVPFRYYRDRSDSLLGSGSRTVFNGNVDIVVGMRERGTYAHSKGGVVYAGYGDRLSVSRIEYRISGSGVGPIVFKSFDFSRMILGQFTDGVDRVYTVYKHYNVVHPEGASNWDKIFSYYVITNTPADGSSGEVRPSDQNYAWNTSARDANGRPVFPNGRYSITVIAYDQIGHATTASDTVTVNN